MSVPSFFDFDLLQQVLIEYFPTVHRSTNSIMKIMGDMTSTSFNLAKWETGRTGVVISPVIRKALSLDCRLNYTPLYKQIAQTVIASMRNRIDNGHQISQAFCEI